MKKTILKITIVRSLFLVVGFLLLSSCKNDQKPSTNIENETIVENDTTVETSAIEKDFLIGSWKDNSAAALDFTILKDGSARSDNMKTMIYKSWTLDGDQITFTIESIGNGTSSTDKETYTIEKLTKNKLTLKSGTYVSEYTKK